MGKNAYLSINLEGSSSAMLNIDDIQNNNESIYKNGRANLISIEDKSHDNDPSLTRIVIKDSCRMRTIFFKVGDYIGKL